MGTAYLTVAEFKKLVLKSNAASSFSDADIEAQIMAASEYADSFLRPVYKLPLVSWGEDLRIHVADIAFFSLTKRRGFNPATDEYQVLKDAATSSLAWLSKVAKQIVAPASIVDSSSDNDEGNIAACVSEPVGW